MFLISTQARHLDVSEVEANFTKKYVILNQGQKGREQRLPIHLVGKIIFATRYLALIRLLDMGRRLEAEAEADLVSLQSRLMLLEAEKKECLQSEKSSPS